MGIRRLSAVAGAAFLLLAAACRPSEQRYRVLESGSEIKQPECVSCLGSGFAPPKTICGRCSGTGLDQRHISGWPEPPNPMRHTGRPYGVPEKPPEPPKSNDEP
jgi:hypothetical protein